MRYPLRHWSRIMYELSWPSGLRRPTQVRFSSEAWVRILPDAVILLAMANSRSVSQPASIAQRLVHLLRKQKVVSSIKILELK